MRTHACARVQSVRCVSIDVMGCCCCAVYLVKETGWVKVAAVDVLELHDRFAAEKAAVAAAAAARAEAEEGESKGQEPDA